MRGISGEAGGARGEVAASCLPPIHMRNNAVPISPSPPRGAEGVGRWRDGASINELLYAHDSPPSQILPAQFPYLKKIIVIKS